MKTPPFCLERGGGGDTVSAFHRLFPCPLTFIFCTNVLMVRRHHCLQNALLPFIAGGFLSSPSDFPSARYSEMTYPNKEPVEKKNEAVHQVQMHLAMLR